MIRQGARGLLAAAVVALLAGAVLEAREWRLLAAGVTAHGEVVGLERRNVAGAKLVAPVVRFAEGHGRMEVFTARPSSSQYAVGEDVDVLYDPANPSRATLDDRISLSAPAIAALGCALVLAGIGLVLLFALRDA